jgi:hypothetical protein
MSFEKIQFVRTPPPTIPPPAVPPATVPTAEQAAAAATFLSTSQQTSNAGKLIQKFQALSETSDYLVSVINTLCGGMGITIDPSTEPDIAAALSRIYSTSEQIPGIDLTMYNNTLTAEMGISRVDLSTGSSSSVMVSPIQRDDLHTVNTAFEQALVENNTYANQLPLQLRALSGDKMIFNYTVNELQNYPILTTGNPTATDVSPVINSSLNNIADRYQTLYAASYLTMAAPDAIALGAPVIITALTPSTNAPSNALTTGTNAITSVLTSATLGIGKAQAAIVSEVSKILVPVNKVIFALGAILTLMNSLKAVFFKQNMSQFTSGLSYILPMLAVEVGIHMLHLDRFLQLATSDTAVINADIQSAISATAQLYGTVLGLGLTPLIMKHQISTLVELAQGQAVSKQPPASLSASGIPEELLKVGSYLNWASQESQRHATEITTNFQKIMNARLNANGNLIEMLSGMKEIESLVAIVQSLLNVQGSLASVPISAVNMPGSLQAFGQIMTNMNTPSGASYSVIGNQLVITPPYLPTPTNTVATTLQNGGANTVNTNYSVPFTH